MYIAIDFDGTIVDHRFPDVGKPVPGAFSWMKEFQELGAKLILWTMRSDGAGDGLNTLSDSVMFCRKNGVEFYGINENPSQKTWSNSPKAYAHVYIDDMAAGCPLKENPRSGGRPYVDWSIVGPQVRDLIKAKASK